MSEIKLLNPSFDSRLQDAILELEHLRRLSSIDVSTPPQIFLQLKFLFHKLESLGSARIEGNRTTLSQYLSTSYQSSFSDSINEIANIEKALSFIDENLNAGDVISEAFIRELQKLVVNELKKEGDQNAGAYRNQQVYISCSKHIPPNPTAVAPLMRELVDFINREDAPKYHLLKIAITHHRFGWIHPFCNGNGRTVRLLTYAMLIKYGFNVGIAGRILNPTAVFCCDRDKYYDMLSVADSMTEEGMEKWCEYVLFGILEEWKKLDILRDYSQVKSKILIPSIKRAHDNSVISKEDEEILLLALEKKAIVASDVSEKLNIPSNKATYKLIQTLPNKSREYTVSLISKSLIYGVINQLDEHGLIPSSLLVS
jgi:Fic family protein